MPSETIQSLLNLITAPETSRDTLRSSLVQLLDTETPAEAELIRSTAYRIKTERIGKIVHFRGLIEFSNMCAKNCLYCGIRSGNTGAKRFTLNLEEITKAAEWAYRSDYGSIVLQSGERSDREFVAFVENILKSINAVTNHGLGITLSLGEQSRETLCRWRDAGAHRYLIRIETSNPALYRQLHPIDHDFEARLQTLRDLRDLEYQVGTGVMVGLPGQTAEDLADDLLFFKDWDIDMIGMGPYVVHSSTPLGEQAPNTEFDRSRRLNLALRMIALTRILCPDINIASSTALQALHPEGREMGVLHGANVIMPIITDKEYRAYYQLYDGKPCIDDSADECRQCLRNRLKKIGEEIGFGERGDSLHYQAKFPLAPRR